MRAASTHTHPGRAQAAGSAARAFASQAELTQQPAGERLDNTHTDEALISTAGRNSQEQTGGGGENGRAFQVATENPPPRAAGDYTGAETG